MDVLQINCPTLDFLNYMSKLHYVPRLPSLNKYIWKLRAKNSQGIHGRYF